MEGSDFDYFARNRPKPEDFPTYEPLQPQVPDKPKIEKEPPKSFWQRYKIIVIAGGVCILVLVGVLLLALINPALSDIDLDVSINRGGFQSGGTMYVDTDNIEVVVRNDGSKIAEGDKITLKVSGENIVDETIQWNRGDIEPNRAKTMTISVQVENALQEFTLKISVYYDGDYHSKDQIP